MVGYSFVWTAVKAVLFLALAMVLGLHLSLAASLSGIFILVLIVLAHIPFALIAASLVLAFRTTGQIPSIVMIASGLLGGVYWSMQAKIIPPWVHAIGDYVPLAPGLRALRQTLLTGASLSERGPRFAPSSRLHCDVERNRLSHVRRGAALRAPHRHARAVLS